MMVHVSNKLLQMKRPVTLAIGLVTMLGGSLYAGTAGAADLTPSVALTGDAPTGFTLSTFNVLGFKHTEPGGVHEEMEDGRTRTRLAIRLLEKHSVDVVGMQELQIEQHEEFVRVGSDRFGIFPSAETAELTRRNVQNSIAWRLTEWELLESYFIKIPYFDGIEWDMPYVLLRNLNTGAHAWFANFHNPATNKRHKGSKKWRTEATRREVELANRLLAETGHPVFVTGDMNEREVYFCRMAGGAPMKASNGGRFRDGICTPPPSPMPVNWIFGSKGGGRFSNWVRDDSRLVNRITDHYVVRADVRIKAAPTAS
jgi:endonuclease/exonuclease/phosphatase family metal-dependent hydrolase